MVRKISKDLPVSNRNTRIMANFVKKKIGESAIPEIFKDLPYPAREGNITFHKPEDFFFWEFGWHSLKTYNDAYLKLREFFGPEVYEECGATVGKFVDLGTMRNMKYALGGVEGALRKVPEINKIFNDTKEFIILEGPTKEGKNVSVSYIIRFHDDIDPHDDWKSDPHIRGILSQIGRPWGMPEGRVIQPIVPYSLEKLCEKEFEFQRLDLDPKVEGDILMIRDPITRKKKILAERVSLLPARLPKERAEAILPRLFGAPIFDGSWDRTREWEYTGFRTIEDLKIENEYKKEKDGKHPSTTLIPDGTILAEGLYFVTRYSGHAASKNPIARIAHAVYYKYLDKGGEEGKDWVEAHMKLVEENKAKEKALRDYSNLVENLEARVGERTRELKQALAEKELAQAQLIQDEKLKSLGKVTAGVSHEINNPMTSVKSGLEQLTGELQKKDDAYEKLKTHTASQSQEEAIIKQVKSTGKRCYELAITNARIPSIEVRKRKQEFLPFFEGIVENPDSFAKDFVRMGLNPDDLKEIFQIYESATIPYILDCLKSEYQIGAIINTLTTSTNRVLDVTTALKRHTHLDQGNIGKIDIINSIEDTLTILQNPIREKKISLNKEYQEVPTIEGYPAEIGDVWMNLIYNAYQAMDQGGKVDISVDDSLNYVIVKVKDNGKGIPEESLEKIFDPFFTTKDQGEGSGLGLYNCINVVKRHGGKIDVRSKPGETEFQVYLSKRAFKNRKA